MIHCHSTPSLIATSSATDTTSCNLFPSELSVAEVDQPPSAGQLLQQRSSNSETAAWTSATAIFERNEPAATEGDGYFTAHASMISLTPQQTAAAIESSKPKPFGDTIFINIGQLSQLNSSHSENSPTPSIQSCDVCRICHGESTLEAPLITPCNCSGSMRYVHQECIQMWLKSSHSFSCELCRFTYLTGTKVKPFRQVRAFRCVYPPTSSLYVLIFLVETVGADAFGTLEGRLLRDDSTVRHLLFRLIGGSACTSCERFSRAASRHVALDQDHYVRIRR